MEFSLTLLMRVFSSEILDKEHTRLEINAPKMKLLLLRVPCPQTMT